MHLFLKEDIELLESQIADMMVRLKDIGEELGESCKQSSETWHDNYPYEEAKRQAALTEIRIRELTEIRRQAEIVEPDTANPGVAIGKTVTVLDKQTGETKTFRIGSYLALAEGSVSYTSPLAAIILGAEAGQTREGVVGGRQKTFEIISVE